MDLASSILSLIADLAPLAVRALTARDDEKAAIRGEFDAAVAAFHQRTSTLGAEWEADNAALDAALARSRKTDP